jgi:RHS repeat-associated protein
VTIGYDDADRRTSVTYPNTNSITYAYNVASELTTVTYKKGTTTLGTLTYTYDLAGNRLTTGGTFARSNIPPALAATTYNANNQQTAFGAATETYDLNGNLATFTDASGTTTYTWNARNQLTAISGPGLTGSFTYDSFGRRTGKTINATTTNFVYDGLNPVQEKNGTTVNANLLTGLGIDEFFTRTDGVGVRSLLPDALGSTVALGDGTGTLQTQYTYEPFGVTTQTGLASTSSYKYTGREDDGTGLLYYRARYYQPRFQRFISEDPIGLAGGLNSYGYARNNPLNWIDAIGQAPSRRSPSNGPKNPQELDDQNSRRGSTTQPDRIPPAPQRSKFCEGAYQRCLSFCNNFCPKKFQPTCQAGCFALYLGCIAVGGDRDGEE